MAQAELYDPVKRIHGKLNKSEPIIMRQKKYKAPNGAVLKEGVQESYTLHNPRDFKKTPPKGREKANMRTFGDASLLATEIIRSGKYTDEELSAMSDEQRAHAAELRQELEELRQRFYAQFNKPDPEAPFEKTPDPNTNILHRKQYKKIDNFIHVIVRERMKNLSANMS